MLIKRETQASLDRLAKEKPLIEELFQTAREQAAALEETLGELTWYLDGYYRAEQYVGKMASNDIDSCLYWLDEAEKQIEQWKADHEA